MYKQKHGNGFIHTDHTVHPKKKKNCHYIYIGKHRHFSNPTSRAGRIFVEYHLLNGTTRQEAKRRALALETVDQVGNGGRNQLELSSASFL
mgnify:CR=1 FL=1